MAQDINPSNNDYVCDVIWSQNEQIEKIYNKFLQKQFDFLGYDLHSKWNKVGLVKRILEKRFKVNYTYLSSVIQYTLEVIDDFENNPKTSWFKDKVTVKDFQEVYVYLMKAKLKYYNTNEKLDKDLISKYDITELSCVEEIEEFVNTEFTDNYVIGEYSVVLYIENKFYELSVFVKTISNNKINYIVQEIEKPTL